MKFAVLFALLAAPLLAAEKQPFILYAVLLEETRVELSDGAVWMMDKGDVFPVEAYKNQQKNIVLKLAGATFMTDTEKTRILKKNEIAAGLEIYRKNVRAYLESTSKKIQKALQETEQASK